MADVISLSSESEQDSDVEVVGVYSDTERTAETIPFIRGEWVNLAAYAPFVINIKDHPWCLPPARRRRTRESSDAVEVLEVVDLCDENASGKEPSCPLSKGGKRIHYFFNKTTSLSPSTRTADSLGRSREGQEPPERDSVVPERRNKDILEPCREPSLHKGSLPEPIDLEGNESEAEKSPSPSKPGGHTEEILILSGDSDSENGESTTASAGSPDRATLEPQEPPGLLEPLGGDVRTVPEHPASPTQTPVRESEDKDEPGSPHTPRDNALSPPPRSPHSPSRCPDEADPRASCAAYGPQETELYSPTHTPFQGPLSPFLSCVSPASDIISCPPNGRKTAPSPRSPRPCSPYPQSPVPHRHHLPPSPPLAAGSPSPSPTPSLGAPLQPNRTPSPTSAQADPTLDASPASYGCSVHSDASDRTGETGAGAEPRSPGANQGGQRSGALLWALKEGSQHAEEEEEEEEEEEKREAGVAHRGASREDRRYVCPVHLRKMRSLMAAPLQRPEEEEEGEDDGFGPPEQLCRQSLSLVYSTMEESYPEGTLQLLSDLLHPRFYPPRDVTAHLLRDVLLDRRAPRALCLEAHALLTRTQRHHPTDRSSVPWDWELLTSVMAEQDDAKRLSSEQVSMLMQYVLLTLEDDFRVKRSLCDLHHSIAKATLSCESGRVSDVIHWLMAAIVKSTGDQDNKEKGDHLKMVLVLQKMLSLALEVDGSPVVSSSKLSQRLFHTCISTVPLREHRMLLLETLESRLLRRDLVEQLLDHACPQKTRTPTSSGLLLHFLKHCAPTPDPTDGSERWRSWEELVQLLWMLQLSHEEVIRGHLRCPVLERSASGRAPAQAASAGSQSDVQEAVESFLSRSQAALDQALPPHVQELLTYLQDHLTRSCLQ